MIIDTVISPSLDDALKFSEIEKHFLIVAMGKVLIEGNPMQMSDAIAETVEKLSEVKPFNMATPNVIVYVSVMTNRMFENPMLRLGLAHHYQESEEFLKTYGYVLED